jgi:hypothetical protein
MPRPILPRTIAHIQPPEPSSLQLPENAHERDQLEAIAQWQLNLLLHRIGWGQWELVERTAKNAIATLRILRQLYPPTAQELAKIAANQGIRPADFIRALNCD